MIPEKPMLLLSALLILGICVSACDPNDKPIIDPPEYQYISTGSGVIGTKGGELYIGDSTSLIRDAMVAINEGVLEGPVRFTITQAPANVTVPLQPQARIIQIQPDTLQLDDQVIVGMSYRHLNPGHTFWIKLYHYDSFTRRLTLLEHIFFDESRRIAYGVTERLGYFTILLSDPPKVETGSFTDTRDNTNYKWVKISNQVWMAENLRYATSAGSWSYADNPGNSNTYGRLYDWYAAASACPPGWHLPSHDEWKSLEFFLGQTGSDTTADHWKEDGSAGLKLKSTSGWTGNGNGVDAVKFTAMPAGFRDGDGTYSFLGEAARFWTRGSSGDYFWARYLENDQDGIFWALRHGNRAFSIRCVQGQLTSLSVVQTGTIDQITTRSAQAAGNVLTAGGSTVRERGICWNKSGYPQNNEDHVAAGSGTGAFTVIMRDLEPNTTYYVRAYAVNATAPAYGSQRTFTTPETDIIETGTLVDNRDLKTYPTVKLGSDWWMAQNLAFETISGSWCYNDLPVNCGNYGRLYEFDIARRACPENWHLATDEEWQRMEEYLGMPAGESAKMNWRGTGLVGKKLKSTTGWIVNGNGDNQSQMNTLPAGFRDGDGTYDLVGSGARFWTATLSQGGDPWIRYLSYDNDGVYRSTRGANRGFSVRCVQD